MRAVSEPTQVRRRTLNTRLRRLHDGQDAGPVTEHAWELLWRGRWQRATVLDEWRWAGRWWTGEAPRDYYRVELAGGAVLELYRRRSAEGERWVVCRVQD